MTLGYWDSQFQFTRLLPDFQDCLARMERQSRSVAAEFRQYSYGPDDRQFVELMGAPAPGSVLPVFIHGGYWRALRAGMHRFVLPALSADTGAVANLEYRLLPSVTLAEVVQDARAGLRRVAEETGCRCVPVGHSAGGHLAVMAALADPEIITGAVGISGLYDLTPLPWSFLRDEVGLTAEDVDGQSPLALWDIGPASHITVAVGEAETPEFHRQAHMFASCHGASVLTVPKAHHMTVLDTLSDAGSPLCRDIQALINRASGHRRAHT